MWAFGIVVFDVFPDKVFEVLFPEYEEMIHTFPLYGSCPAFNVRVQKIKKVLDKCVCVC